MTNLHQIAVAHDLYYSTVRRRYQRGLRGEQLVNMSERWREWNGRELAFLDHHYQAGMPITEIARHLGRSYGAVKIRAGARGLVHPGRSAAQKIRNFEAAAGKPLDEIAKDYSRRRLSRRDLAGAIGISCGSLRRHVSTEIWDQWPRMTIGRIDSARERAGGAA